MKILLVDDHRLVADAMAIMLQELQPGVEVSVCHSTQRALALIDDNQRFDLILTDMYMPGIDGMGFMHGLRQRRINTPVVIISSTQSTRLTQTAIEQGAAGFIQKSTPGAEMLEAIRDVMQGKKVYPPGIELPRNPRAPSDNVTSADAAFETPGPRQIEVLELMAQGNSNKQIAQLLEISEATVKYHTSQLFKLLSVHNRTSCIREGQRRNLISSQ